MVRVARAYIVPEGKYHPYYMFKSIMEEHQPRRLRVCAFLDMTLDGRRARRCAHVVEDGGRDKNIAEYKKKQRYYCRLLLGSNGSCRTACGGGAPHRRRARLVVRVARAYIAPEQKYRRHRVCCQCIVFKSKHHTRAPASPLAYVSRSGRFLQNSVQKGGRNLAAGRRGGIIWTHTARRCPGAQRHVRPEQWGVQIFRPSPLPASPNVRASQGCRGAVFYFLIKKNTVERPHCGVRTRRPSSTAQSRSWAHI